MGQKKGEPLKSTGRIQDRPPDKVLAKKPKPKYLEYDYESAYKHQLNALDEYFLTELLREGKVKSIYATKEIRAGDQLEVEIYPEFTRRQRDEVPPDGLKKKDRTAQHNLNDKNSRKRCERIINANFTNRDIWITLTYTDKHMPHSEEEAKKNITNYLKRLNYRRKKLGLGNALWVCVTECSPKGRWHHHIVMDGKLDMDTVEKLWTLGNRNEVRRLEKDEHGLSGMANYITKSKAKGKKTWTCSRGLKRPDERKNHYKFKARTVERIVRGQVTMQDELAKWYAQEGYIFTKHEVRYNDWNGHFYIYARMRRVQDRSGEDALRMH